MREVGAGRRRLSRERTQVFLQISAQRVTACEASPIFFVFRKSVQFKAFKSVTGGLPVRMRAESTAVLRRGSTMFLCNLGSKLWTESERETIANVFSAGA